MSRPAKGLEKRLIERYSGRLSRFGDDPRTLGWDTRAHQRARFMAALGLVKAAGKSVLDVGCGFGDFLSLLKERRAGHAAYLGVDINRDLLAVARAKHRDARFARRNLYDRPFAKPVCDVGFMFGLLNFKLERPTNEDWSRTLIRNAFKACREALAVDMLSSRRDPSYPKEDFVHYSDPCRVLEWAFTLTPHAALRHDYASIPQREFILVLRRKPEVLP